MIETATAQYHLSHASNIAVNQCLSLALRRLGRLPETQLKLMETNEYTMKESVTVPMTLRSYLFVL